MRRYFEINNAWHYIKNTTVVPLALTEEAQNIDLPHTWNGIDGQDGNNDYFRGTCCYAKKIRRAQLPVGERHFLEVNGANSSADVYLNGKHLAHHDGGYSTWRVDLTETLQEENILVILVDNAPNETVYPQQADFTFYGGLYRSVNIIAVPETHFELLKYGHPGIHVTPIVEGDHARVNVDAPAVNLQIVRKLCSPKKNTSSAPGIFVFHKDITVLQYSALLDQIKVHFGKAELLRLNDQLNKIKKPRQ